MVQSRRRLLVTSLSGIAAFFLRSKTTAAQDATIPLQNPPIRTSPRRDDDSDNGSLPAAATKKAILEQHQKDIKKDVEKLYDLATQLKTEVDKTDATSVLSIAMIKKTEEIEKLAKQIRDHAKGS